MTLTLTGAYPMHDSTVETAIPTADTPAHEEHRGSRRGFLATLLLALPLLAGACAGGDTPAGPSSPGPGTGGGPGTVPGGGGGGGGGTQPTTPGAQFVGVYELVSVNGNSLATPYVEHHLGNGTYGRQYVEEGSIEFFANNTYAISLKKALTIGNGPRVYAPITETGTWSYTSSGMSGTVLLGPNGGNGYTIEVTPYTVTDTRQLDPFSESGELLIFAKE